MTPLVVPQGQVLPHPGGKDDAPLRPLVTEQAHHDNALAARTPIPDPPTPTSLCPKAETPAPQLPDIGPSQTSQWAALPARGHRREALVARSFLLSAPPAKDSSRSSRSSPDEPEPIPDDIFDQTQGG